MFRPESSFSRGYRLPAKNNLLIRICKHPYYSTPVYAECISRKTHANVRNSRCKIFSLYFGNKLTMRGGKKNTYIYSSHVISTGHEIIFKRDALIQIWYSLIIRMNKFSKCALLFFGFWYLFNFLILLFRIPQENIIIIVLINHLESRIFANTIVSLFLFSFPHYFLKNFNIIKFFIPFQGIIR